MQDKPSARQLRRRTRPFASPRSGGAIDSVEVATCRVTRSASENPGHVPTRYGGGGKVFSRPTGSESSFTKSN
jgi:hypothetical protein